MDVEWMCIWVWLREKEAKKVVIGVRFWKRVKSLKEQKKVNEVYDAWMW